MKPIIPVIEGFEFFANERRVDEDCCGDFNYFTPLNQDEIAIAMCDLFWGISGPTTELFAILASEVKNSIVTFLEPERILERLDIVFTPILNPPDSFRSGFFTMSLVVLNMHDGAMKIVNGGHPWMVIRRTDGSLEFPDREIKGRLIGMDYGDDSIKAENLFEQRVTKLDPGDVAIIYSDGVIEAIDIHGNWFGGLFDLRTFGEVIARTDGGPKAIGDAVIKRFEEFTEGAQKVDNMSIICFGLKPDFRPATT